MLQITEITNEPKQKHTLNIEGFSSAILNLEFKPNQNAWFFSVEWETFSASNIRLVNNYNVLRKFRKIIPFGFWIDSKSDQDPMTDDAFSGGDCQFYLLTADEVLGVEAAIYA
jgi:hypothetical protein